MTRIFPFATLIVRASNSPRKDRTGKHSSYSERVNLHGLVFL